MESDLIEEKIKQVNKKALPISGVSALLVGTVILLFGPTLKFSIVFGFAFSIITLSAIYQILFLFLGREVMKEAQKRKRGLYKILACNGYASSFEDRKSSCSIAYPSDSQSDLHYSSSLNSTTINTDPAYHHLSSNIYHHTSHSP